jgi:hypothetical protein
MRVRQGTPNNRTRTTFKLGTVVTRQKWSKFENDQLPGQTWSNMVKYGQIWSNMVKSGQRWSEKNGQKRKVVRI